MNLAIIKKTTALISGLIWGLALSRLLFEGFFPAINGLGRPWGAALCAFAGAGLAYLWHKRVPWWLWLIFWLNLWWLIDPAVDLVRSRLVFIGTISLFGYGWATEQPVESASRLLWWQRPAIWLGFALIPLYGLTLGQTVGANDTFEFQVVIPQLGIVHPTGYPLYLMLGKLWTLVLPFGPVAWRINVGTAVYGIIGTLLLYRLIKQVTEQLWPSDLPAKADTISFFSAFTFATTPTFWSQAAEAEVYTLHILIVALVLNQLLTLYQIGFEDRFDLRTSTPQQTAALLGLGLTNHLTTVFLVPATAFAYLSNKETDVKTKLWALRWVIPAALAPLPLYLYLPIRWRAVNQEAMGVARFWSWVSGGRFQDALQWWAWWRDPTRYEVVGRLFMAEWATIFLALAGLGFIWLAFKNWRLSLIFTLTWLGYTFYCLNYYVPDLNVFLLPSQFIIAVWIGVGLQAINVQLQRWIKWPHWALILFLATLPLLINRYTAVDRSTEDGLIAWGTGVLQQPLAQDSIILADSEKIAPLYYLQQAEGLRPDLDIKVLFTEAEYRQVLDSQIAAGQTVYLARFLPNLAGQYHLRSVGPLTEVSQEPLTTLPSQSKVQNISFGKNQLSLIGTLLETPAAVDPQSVGLTLYWTAEQPTAQPLQVYVRWAGQNAINPAGTHPANDDYPTVAWRSGEIVPDFHLLPIPNHPAVKQEIEVALAPAFTPADELAWQIVATADLSQWPEPSRLLHGETVRAQFGTSALTSYRFPTQIRTTSEFSLATAGDQSNQIKASLVPQETQDDGQGIYEVIAQVDGARAVCGWLRSSSTNCTLGTVQVSGIPVPEGATNFGDLIALRQVSIDETVLVPGNTLAVQIEWQALAPIPDDYTVFVQILTADDQLVGQVDSWPLQGTLPTTAWETGKIVADPYQIPLAADLPSGNYRLIIGFYRLADLQRLPVVDINGQPLDDKYEIEGLIVPDVVLE